MLFKSSILSFATLRVSNFMVGEIAPHCDPLLLDA